MADEPVPLAEQIAAVREMVERIRDPKNAGRWPSLAPVLPSVLATLEAQPALLAVVAAARNFLNSRNSAGRWDLDMLHRLHDVLAALPPAPDKEG
jgi:hypothetical protein